MQLLRNAPIQKKLLWIIMLTTSSALLLASVAFVGYDLIILRRTLVEEFSSVAQMIGGINTGALSFDDPKSADESFRALRQNANIVSVVIVNTNNQVFAQYRKDSLSPLFTPQITEERRFEFSRSHLDVTQPIFLDTEFMGTIGLRSNLDQLYSRLQQYVISVFLVFLLSLAVALLISLRLQRLISRPVKQLADKMEVVSSQKDYSVRVPEESHDELGQLIHGFNEMLSQLQVRDDALQRARDDLEKRVLERTQELQAEVTERKKAEEALQISVDRLKAFARKLEQSNRELQDFAYVASHDLQEPLRKVQAFGDRLKTRYATQIGDEGNDYLGRMQNAAARMQNLINDLLAFSRVTTKASPFLSVDLNQVLKEVVSDLEVRIQQSGGKLEAGNLPVIEADALQMRQLLQNLLSNAFKFNKPGETPLVRISSSTGDGRCQISVQDNGIGFDERYLDRIFTVFQRLHGRTTYEGTGIGLAICRKIVERHLGVITARSKPGEGATFIVTLPLKQSKEPETKI